MTYIKVRNKIIITDESESDFRQMLSDELGDEVVRWFDSIIEPEEEPEGENWEAIADDLRNAMVDILDIAQDLTLTKNNKLDSIERIVNQYI